MLSERLQKILSERRISKEKFAEMCDLPVETVKNVYYGKTSDPKLSTALKMADALGLSVNCLVGQCQHTPQERALLMNYRNCGQHGKSVIDLVSRYESSSVKNERDSVGTHKIPCIMPQGEIHKGIIYDLCETSEIETTVKDAYIGILMPTNDLAPLFCKGDIILFEDRFPKQNEKAAFYQTDRIYIRKFIEEDGKYRLKCLHGLGTDIILKRMDEVDYIGTCIDVVRS